MIEFLIVLGVIVTYLVVGLVFARSQAERVYREQFTAKREAYRSVNADTIKRWAVADARTELAMFTAVWPFVLVARLSDDLFSRTVMAPVTARQEQVAQLRRDAEHWSELGVQEPDPAAKRMAHELARILREQAKELES